jgi:CheY-like chemotaxis protein
MTLIAEMRKKLLLADDSITIQRVIALTFADEPIDVEAVSDGAAAIARLDASPPDIVLADIGMPGRDGYEVALHVRRTPALAHIPVILLTGAFDPVDHARARDARCAGVLVKPFDPQMLIARVRQLLEAPSAGVLAASAGAGETEAPAVANVAAEAGGTPDRAADPDEYFARLDRAFATLSTPAPGASAPEKAAGKTVAVAPDGASGASDPSQAVAAGAAPVSPQQPAEQLEPVEAAGVPTVSPMTLGDVFAALLAIEQGWAVPDLPRLAREVFPRELVEEVARRVSREISERVVRELAPAIVTEVAERLVREEMQRLQLVPPTHYDRRS